MNSLKLAGIGGALLVVFAVTGAVAGNKHDTAKELRDAGEVQPLEVILEKARQVKAGRIIETELERKKGRYIYEIELVDDEGSVWELKFDAVTSELLKTEQEK